ncbi:MAG: alpha/beta hydrolase [Actinomycetota bacterium]|nr:alpha/beta hydrolase [Actinomycetota bacterium]
MEQERRELRTPDGRRIVFHVAGPERGDLVFFHTGTPGIPNLYAGMIRQCVARGLRIACIARPGYSGSDRLPGRCYADNPADTALVADALGAESFFSSGYSGGGGPALADAALLPDRTRAAAVGATLAPRFEMGPGWWQGLDEANGEELAAMEAGESALRAYVEMSAENMRQIKTGEQMTRGSEFSRLYAPVDYECLRGEFLDFVLEANALAIDGVDGWIDDDFAFFGDWGFDLSRIEVPVTIWQGGQDRIIPVSHTEWLAENVPGARFHLEPEDSHSSLLNRHFGAILDELIELGA